MPNWSAPLRIVTLFILAWLLLLGAWLWSISQHQTLGLMTVAQEYGLALLLSVLLLILWPVLILALLRPLQRQLGQLDDDLAEVLRDSNRKVDLPQIQAEPLRPITERIKQLLTTQDHDQTRLAQRLAQQEYLNRQQSQALHAVHCIVWETLVGQARIERLQGAVDTLFHHPASVWQAPDFFSQHLHPEDSAWLHAELQQTQAERPTQIRELQLRDGQGDWRWVQLSLSTLVHAGVVRHIGTLQDISAIKQQQQLAQTYAQQDALTGIGNRVWFMQQLTEHLEQARHERTPGAVFFLDLDRFDFTNSVFGQAVGDEFLKRFTDYLSELFSDSGIVGRLGGDEFGVLLPKTDANQATEYAQQLLNTLQGLQFPYASSHIPFSASLGISLFPEHGHQAYGLLTRAAVALQQAKARGRGTYQLASGAADDHKQLGDTAAWEQRLRKAVEDDAFVLHFQPIIDLDIGVIHYYECFLRLLEPHDPSKTYGPGLFMNAAEQLGLCDVIEARSLEQAIRSQGLGTRSGQAVSLTINLSHRQLNQADLAEQIRTAVKTYKANPRRIVFEINAKSAANNMLRIRQVVHALREDGFRFAWDDFGVGALSFEDLRTVPFDYIKIDGELTTKVVWSPADRAMVKAIADLAQGLNMVLMAEAVETEPMLRILRDDHVAFGQGRLFAEPAPRFHEHERIIVSESKHERRR